MYRLIEESCDPSGEWTQSDEWTQLANWSFHQALSELAEHAAAEKVIRREDVTFDMFDYWIRSNLTDECWDEERREYEDSASRFH